MSSTIDFAKYLNTPRAALTPAERAIQTLVHANYPESAMTPAQIALRDDAYAFNLNIKSRDLTDAQRAIRESTVKPPVDRKAAAAKAQATMKANIAAAAAAFAASRESTDA